MLTPNDISSKKFEKSAFGYKPEEVDADEEVDFIEVE